MPRWPRRLSANESMDTVAMDHAMPEHTSGAGVRARTSTNSCCSRGGIDAITEFRN